MPAIGAMDPADLEAKARADLGFSQRLEQSRRISPPPSLGGSGYALWYRQQQLERFHTGGPIDVSFASIYKLVLRSEPFA
jgi:hypothetical protein